MVLGPLAASTCVSEGVCMSWAAMFKALRNKSCISGSPKHLKELTALWRRWDFAQVAIFSRIVPRLVVPAALHTTIASAEGTDEGSDVTAMWHAGTTASNTLVTFWRVTRKLWQPWETDYDQCPNWELLAAKRQTFSLDFCCALPPTRLMGANALCYQKWAFPDQTYALLAT